MPDGAFPELLRIPEAATLLGVRRQTIYRWAAEGKVPGLIRVGKTLRVNADVLREWIARNSENVA